MNRNLCSSHVHRFRIALLPLIAISVAAAIPEARSAVIADFSGGDGTTQPDQYKGVAGNGWADAWGSRNGSGGTTTIGVENTNPFGSGGNYLQLDYLRSTAGGSNRAGVARTFETGTAGGINMTSPYTISFDFRADTLTVFNTSADQFAFSSESSTTIGAFGPDAPWSLLIRGDTGWVVTNGNGSGGVTNLNFSSLGLTSLTVNTIYTIKIFIDPLNSAYDLTITTGGNTYRASDLNGNQLLGFRTNATAASANVLQFRSTNDAVGDEQKWSLDNIAVVPEPHTAALFLGGMICMAWKFRQRP